jgi:hypothetical protein
MRTYFRLLRLVLFVLLMLSCTKDKNDNEENDSIVDANYTGFLEVRYTNEYPQWDVSTQIEANIDKDLSVILFSSGTLHYSGEIVIGNDSKIVREGTWQIQPVGFMEKAGNDVTISVDGGVTITSDIQRIYAKVNGNWVLVNETDFASTPDADLIFSLHEADVGGGSEFGITTENGSIVWTLYLTASLVK